MNLPQSRMGSVLNFREVEMPRHLQFFVQKIHTISLPQFTVFALKPFSLCINDLQTYQKLVRRL